MRAKQDHFIPHIFEKKTTKEMFDALVSLYQSENIKRKIILQNKLRSMEMIRSNLVTSYVMKVIHIRDQLVVVGEKVVDVELVIVSMRRLRWSQRLGRRVVMRTEPYLVREIRGPNKGKRE